MPEKFNRTIMHIPVQTILHLLQYYDPGFLVYVRYRVPQIDFKIRQVVIRLLYYSMDPYDLLPILSLQRDHGGWTYYTP